MKFWEGFGRKLFLGLAALGLLGAQAQGQYVYTTIDDPVAKATSGTTYVTGISGNVVAGYYFGPQLHGFYHTLGTTNYTTLDVPAGTTGTDSSTAANGISGNNIVGYYQATNYSGTYGFIYNIATSNYTTLADAAVSDGNTSYLEALGIDGSNIVGNVISLVPLAGTYQEVFLATPSAGGENFSTFYYPSPSQVINEESYYLSNYTTRAFGISVPNVVGYWLDENYVYHGYIYNLNTASYTLLASPSGGGCPLTGIDGNNVVGYYADPNYGYNYSGFIYNMVSSNYTATSLHDPLAPGNTFVEGISGGTIVGYYLDNDGVTHGFVASTPVPVLNLKVVGASQIFTATNGLPGSSCFILDTTNLALPVNQWSELSSNVFNTNGIFTFTNPVVPGMPPAFYGLSKTP
jgi:hypothetical protein